MNSRNPSFCVGAAMAIPAASSVNVIINECYQTSKRRPRTSHGKRHATGYGRLCKVIKQDTDLLLHEDIIVLHEIPAIFDCWGRLPSASSSFLCAISSLQEASDVTAFSHRCLPCSSSPSAVSTDSNDAVSFVIPEDFSEVERFLGESFCELDDMDDNYFSSDSVVPKLMQIDDDLTATESLVPEMEIGPEVNDASVTIDLSPSASLKNDYRIDLSEFEPAEGSFDDEQCSKEKSPCNSRLCLTLDYEDVMNEWSDRGSLWMDGIRPQIVPHDYDLDLEFSSYSQMVPTDVGSLVPDNQYGEVHGQPAEEGQNGREARVLRFKEKRRTRFFSKKIRYQVRKLNAERRPRVKGRFIKRLHMDSR